MIKLSLRSQFSNAISAYKRMIGTGQILFINSMKLARDVEQLPEFPATSLAFTFEIANRQKSLSSLADLLKQHCEENSGST